MLEKSQDKMRRRKINYIDNVIEEKCVIKNYRIYGWMRNRKKWGEGETVWMSVTNRNRFNAKQIEIKTTRKQPNKFIFILFFHFDMFASNYLLLVFEVRWTCSLKLTYSLSVCLSFSFPFFPSPSIHLSIVFHFYRCLCLNIDLVAHSASV